MILWIITLSISFAYGLLRLLGLNFFLGFSSLDYFFIFLAEVSIIGLTWVKIKGWSLLWLIPFVPIALIYFFISTNYIIAKEDVKSDTVDYYVYQNKDIDRFINEAKPGDMSTYTIYRKVAGPIYILEEKFRYQTDTIGGSTNSLEVEKLLKEVDLEK